MPGPKVANVMQNINPELLLAAFLPVLLFSGAFNLEWHLVRRLKWSALLLAGALPARQHLVAGIAVLLEALTQSRLLNPSLESDQPCIDYLSDYPAHTGRQTHEMSEIVSIRLDLTELSLRCAERLPTFKKRLCFNKLHPYQHQQEYRCALQGRACSLAELSRLCWYITHFHTNGPG